MRQITDEAAANTRRARREVERRSAIPARQTPTLPPSPPASGDGPVNGEPVRPFEVIEIATDLLGREPDHLGRNLQRGIGQERAEHPDRAPLHRPAQLRGRPPLPRDHRKGLGIEPDAIRGIWAPMPIKGPAGRRTSAPPRAAVRRCYSQIMFTLAK